MKDRIPGAQIQALRESLNETRSEFAERLKCSNEAVRKWEVGKAIPTGARRLNIQNLLKHFNVHYSPKAPSPWTARDVVELQELAGLNTVEFARKLGVSDRIVVKWRAGQMNLMPTSEARLNKLYLQLHPPAEEAKPRAVKSTLMRDPSEAASVTPEQVHMLRDRYGETTHQFAKRFGVTGSFIGGWERASQNIPDKHQEKLRAMLRKVHRAENPSEEESVPAAGAKLPEDDSPQKPRIAVASILENVQSFKDRRNKTLVDDALTYVASNMEQTKPQARKLIATFLYLVYEDVPLNVILTELTGHST